MNSHNLAGNVLSYRYGSGGFVIWRGSPRGRVFMDSRL